MSVRAPHADAEFQLLAGLRLAQPGVAPGADGVEVDHAASRAHELRVLGHMQRLPGRAAGLAIQQDTGQGAQRRRQRPGLEQQLRCRILGAGLTRRQAQPPALLLLLLLSCTLLCRNLLHLLRRQLRVARRLPLPLPLPDSLGSQAAPLPGRRLLPLALLLLSIPAGRAPRSLPPSPRRLADGRPPLVVLV